MSSASHADLGELGTARLLLTRIAPSDLPEIARMHENPEVMATLGGLRSAEQTQQFVADWIAHWNAHGFGLWVARDAASGAFAGRGGLRHVVVGGRSEIEVAYGFMPAFWGRGYATELARESLRVGFDELGCADLVCFTLVTNRASQRVMEKVGFGFERDVEHAAQPHRLYRLAASSWRRAATR